MYRRRYRRMRHNSSHNRRNSLAIAWAAILFGAVSSLFTGCSKNNGDEAAVSILENSSADVSEVSAEISADGSAESSADPIQFETTSEARPEFTASDYIELPEYMGMTVTDIDADEVTDYDVINKVRTDCIADSIDYIDLDSITDEQAAILSDQKYQTAQEYLQAVRDMLELKKSYDRKQSLFLNMLDQFYYDIDFSSVPEDVYAYDTSQESIMQYALEKGYDYSQAVAMYAEDAQDSDIALRDTLIQEKELLLRVEMVIRCMGEDFGIEEPTNAAWNTLMANYGVFNRDDLYDYYTEDELELDLLSVDVINAAVANADIEPVKYYSYSELAESAGVDANNLTIENQDTDDDIENTESINAAEEYQTTENAQTADAETLADAEDLVEISIDELLP